jgi:hypothetical protein
MPLTIVGAYYSQTIETFSGSTLILLVEIINPRYFVRTTLNLYFLMSTYSLAS